MAHTNYWGSVRFFKHVIILALALMIVVPSTLAVRLGLQNSRLRATAQLVSHETAPPLVDVPALIAPPAGAEQLTAAHIQQPWETLYPELYAPAAARSTVDEDKTVYLTFDDGPSAETPKVLEILARYNIKATFFVLGREDEQSRQWMRDVVAAGHTLGIHSYTHDYKQIYASVEAYLEDFQRAYDLVTETTGVAPTIFRFPGGSMNGYNAATYQDITAEMVRRGFVYFDWNVSAGDASATGADPSAKTLTENALKHVGELRRAVVLLHDSADKTSTVEALPAIIEGYQAAGYTFAALTPEVLPVVYAYPTLA